MAINYVVRLVFVPQMTIFQTKIFLIYLKSKVNLPDISKNFRSLKKIPPKTSGKESFFSRFLFLYHQLDIIRKTFVFVFIPHSSSEQSTYLKSSERKSIPFCFTSIECTIIKWIYLHMAIICRKNVTKWIQNFFLRVDNGKIHSTYVWSIIEVFLSGFYVVHVQLFGWFVN